jgi:hypothetical protein
VDGLIGLVEMARSLRPAVAAIRRDVDILKAGAVAAETFEAEAQALKNLVHGLNGRVGAMGETAVVEARKVIKEALAEVERARDGLAREVKPLGDKAAGALLTAQAAAQAVEGARAEGAAAFAGWQAGLRDAASKAEAAARVAKGAAERAEAAESKATAAVNHGKNLDGLAARAKEEVQALAARAAKAESALSEMRAGVAAIAGRLNHPDTAGANAASYSSALAALTERVVAMESEVHGEGVVDRLEEHESEVRTALTQAFGPGGLLDGLLRRVEAIEAREGPTPPAPPPGPRREVNAAPGAWLSAAEWCAMEGTHTRAVRNDSDRMTMGRRLVRAYRSAGLMPQGNRYRVRDMRLYVQWLSTAGLMPDPEAWVEFWKTHGGPEPLSEWPAARLVMGE